MTRPVYTAEEASKRQKLAEEGVETATKKQVWFYCKDTSTALATNYTLFKTGVGPDGAGKSKASRKGVVAVRSREASAGARTTVTPNPHPNHWVVPNQWMTPLNSTTPPSVEEHRLRLANIKGLEEAQREAETDAQAATKIHENTYAYRPYTRVDTHRHASTACTPTDLCKSIHSAHLHRPNSRETHRKTEAAYRKEMKLEDDLERY